MNSSSDHRSPDKQSVAPSKCFEGTEASSTAAACSRQLSRDGQPSDAIALDYISATHKYQRLAPLMDYDWSMLLDSGSFEMDNETIQNKSSKFRRFDICVFEPTVQLTYQNQTLTTVEAADRKITSCRDPLSEMRNILGRVFAQQASENLSSLSSNDINPPQSESLIPKESLPFCGGWMGYISYDFGRELLLKKDCASEQSNTSEQANPSRKTTCQSANSVQDKLSSGPNVAMIKMGLYQSAIITDHLNRTSIFYNFCLPEKQWLSQQQKVLQIFNCQPSSIKAIPALLTTPFKSNLSFNQYQKAFEKVQEYLKSGDCYQVNLAQRFNAKYKGPSFSIYHQLARANNSPFSAYLNFSDQQILSLSPERFIESHEGKVLTQPIKGTLPRSTNPTEDKKLARQLINSEKDKSENLMIVDLLRNDLSKTAAKGSVKVTELFGLYQFESVHHLISSIQSQLDPQFDNFDLLKTTLPGGSITGAPKVRAMQIIDELEASPRGIYCGIIGYIDRAGNMDTNICIRTLVAQNEQLFCWAGGGLVVDSQLDSEYQETFDKLNKILPILENTRLDSAPQIIKDILSDKNEGKNHQL
jgi:para-aminobenzoate synthetase component I